MIVYGYRGKGRCGSPIQCFKVLFLLQMQRKWGCLCKSDSPKCANRSYIVKKMTDPLPEPPRNRSAKTSRRLENARDPVGGPCSFAASRLAIRLTASDGSPQGPAVARSDGGATPSRGLTRCASLRAESGHAQMGDFAFRPKGRFLICGLSG